jgi:3-oxoacyl-[acyl-carrier protein] reductase
MGLTVSGLPAEVKRAILAAFAGAHDRVSCEVAVVGVTCDTGPALHLLGQDGWSTMIKAVRDATFAIQEAAVEMVEAGAGGRIIVVVPGHSLRTSAGAGAAAVAGSFLTTVAQVAAAELGGKGIRVNVVAAGPLEGTAPARTADAVPAGRLTRPEDIAGACLMLASPEAGFVNGAVIAVDGGYAITKAAGGSPFAATSA